MNASKSGGLHHGSHPEHGFVRLPYAPQGYQCTICKAAASNSEVAWFRCGEAECPALLCHKCFDVEEQLFGSVQVVIRSPLIPHDDTSAAVRTRPRPSGHKLAPLYAGKFMEVVSRAVCADDPKQVYFRLRSGGWINSKHVVCAITSKNLIESLAWIHLRANTGVSNPSSNHSPCSDISPGMVIEYIVETITMLETSPHYGIVMAAITLYPIHYVVSVLASPASLGGYPHHEENEESGGSRPSLVPELAMLRSYTSLIDNIINFVHNVLYFALTELECSIDDGERVEDGTMLSLFEDVIAGCVLVVYNLQRQCLVELPQEFINLMLRTLVLFGRIYIFLRPHDGPVEPLRLQDPAVISSHIDLPCEWARLYRLSSFVTDVAGRVLLTMHNIPSTLEVKDLKLIREQLSYAANEVLEETFCELLAVCMRRGPSIQRQFFSLDPLEIVVRLAKRATLAESQIAVVRLIADAAHRCPRNIALMSSVVIYPLIKMASSSHSPAALSTALDCFSDLAFNDPRAGEGGGAFRGLPFSPLSHARRGTETPPEILCTRSLHPHTAPFQLMHGFTLENGLMVNYCGACALAHPPEGGVPIDDAEYGYFSCQCSCNPRGGGRKPLPPPSIPHTAAIQILTAAGLANLLLASLKAYPDNPAVLNAVGGVVLRVEVPEEVINTLFYVLVEQGDLGPFAEAALGVASRAFLPSIEALCKNYVDTPLTEYIRGPPVSSTPFRVSQSNDTPPGVTSQGKSDVGLSPSPYGISAYQSSCKSDEYQSTVFQSHLHTEINLYNDNIESSGL
ncbi:unnamed protein product [Phytomonas sp. Hart1]|nr:unnamed protein product [Phytomonas sp. Hart1]|eukprot:CCW70076.1 unnamed protein product [Phytomonas sp. isolate Hart1]